MIMYAGLDIQTTDMIAQGRENVEQFFEALAASKVSLTVLFIA